MPPGAIHRTCTSMQHVTHWIGEILVRNKTNNVETRNDAGLPCCMSVNFSEALETVLNNAHSLQHMATATRHRAGCTGPRPGPNHARPFWFCRFAARVQCSPPVVPSAHVCRDKGIALPRRRWQLFDLTFCNKRNEWNGVADFGFPCICAFLGPDKEVTHGVCGDTHT